MKKHFIDCGGYRGDSAKLFFEKYPNALDYEVHIFEPLFDIDVIWKNTFFHKKAVWIKNGHAEFYKSRDKLEWGSSLIKEKQSGNLDLNNPIIIETIDLDEFISELISEEIILKMDIEGAEYEILPKMIASGSINKINKIYAEWHFNKIPKYKNSHESLMRFFSKSKVKVSDQEFMRSF